MGTQPTLSPHSHTGPGLQGFAALEGHLLQAGSGPLGQASATVPGEDPSAVSSLARCSQNSREDVP